MFISECVLVYMEPEESEVSRVAEMRKRHTSESPLLQRVIRWAAEKFPSALFAVYEQIHPDDPFGRTMMRNLEVLLSLPCHVCSDDAWWQSRGCSLRSLKTYPTPQSQQHRFLSMGWNIAAVRDMNTVYSTYLPKEDLRRCVGFLNFVIQ